MHRLRPRWQADANTTEIENMGEREHNDAG